MQGEGGRRGRHRDSTEPPTPPLSPHTHARARGILSDSDTPLQTYLPTFSVLLPFPQEKHPYAKTDAQEMSRVLDSGSLDAESMLRWLKRITKETFEEEEIGAIHDEI